MNETSLESTKKVESRKQNLWSDLYQQWAEGHDRTSKRILDIVHILSILAPCALALRVELYASSAAHYSDAICAGSLLWIFASLITAIFNSDLVSHANNRDFFIENCRNWWTAFKWPTILVLGGAIMINGCGPVLEALFRAVFWI